MVKRARAGARASGAQGNRARRREPSVGEMAGAARRPRCGRTEPSDRNPRANLTYNKKGLPWEALENGAGEETRTLDVHLGKVVLYQLSYARDAGCKE